MPIMVVEAMVVTAMVAMDIQDTTEANALPKPKLSHGMDMVTAHTHMLMVDTDTHMPIPVTTTLERDLLMLNPTTDMVVIMAVDTDMAVDTVTDMADKKLSSLHYLNFLNCHLINNN